MVKRPAITLAVLAGLFGSSSASNAQCVSSSQSTGYLTGTNAIQLVFSGFTSGQLTEARYGYGQWNRSTCNGNGSAFPLFQETAAGANRIVTVTMTTGLNPVNNNSCGNYSNVTGAIRMYTQVRNPGTGIIVPCTGAGLLRDTTSHELGHALGLQNVGQSCSSYIMSPASFNSQNQYNDTRGVQQAECNMAAGTNVTPTEATPPAPPTPPPPPSGGTEPAPGCDPTSCSPIILLLGPGPPSLTGADDPVDFDIDADGFRERISWTAAEYEGGGFLVLDRDWSGRIESSAELFGTATAQPPTAEPNGFLALAEFDLAANGGNGDALITAEDAVFDRLGVWFDRNHDAGSQPAEITPLSDTGVLALELS